MLKRARHMLQHGRELSRNARGWTALDAGLVQASRTPFEVIHQQDIVRLRYYPPLQEEHILVEGLSVPVQPSAFPIPLVLVAPLAVNMHLYDLFPERSLVKYLRARGFAVYLIDWGSPQPRHNHHHLHTYFAELLPALLQQVREHSGSRKLSLHGWSLGGLFSYCHAALGDPDVANLVLVGAPNDYHANGKLGLQYQRLSRALQRVESRFGWRVHASRKRYWRTPGWGNALTFKLTNPINSLRSYVDLLHNLDDREFVSRHATNAAFLDRMEAYPGGVIQDVIQYLWVDNVLADGGLPMPQNKARLDAIQAPVLSIVGRQDPIVTKDCASPLLAQIGSTDQTLTEVDGGHMGIVGGSRAPRQSWSLIGDWLASRSGECPPTSKVI